jgi:hypothetical protein
VAALARGLWGVLAAGILAGGLVLLQLGAVAGVPSGEEPHSGGIVYHQVSVDLGAVLGPLGAVLVVGGSLIGLVWGPPRDTTAASRR